MRIPIVAIVGRPNVGKSTLFNAIVGERRAIVEDTPGVTRDRNYAFVEGRYPFPFSLVDTGGFDSTLSGVIEDQVREQTRLAIEEADLLIVLFDGKTGVQPGDEEVVNLIRRYEKPSIYCVNKVDGIEQVERIYDFYALGVSELKDLSALYGRNLKDILAQALSLIPDSEELTEIARQTRERRAEELEALGAAAKVDESEEEEFVEDAELTPSEFREEVRELRAPNFAPVFIPGESELSKERYDKEYRLAEVVSGSAGAESEDEVWEAIEGERDITSGPESIELVRVAIIGRPNVGKSTMLNTLLGETRAITSPVAGTTRDTLDVTFEHEGQKYLLTDTAGLRKKGRITDHIEKYSSMRTLRAISDADVALLLLDATEGPTEQDQKIAGIAHDQGKGLIIVANKWDLIEKDHKTAKGFKDKVEDTFKFAPYAPLIHTSAKSGRRVVKILPEALRVALSRSRRIPTGSLNRLLKHRLRRISPPSYRGVPIKLFYANQVDVAPPRFALFLNHTKGVHFSYLRFIKNTIREAYSFTGTDLKLILRQK
jgi:GTP-binding protein